MDGPTGTKNLGSHTFYVNKTHSSQSVKCGSEIHSNGTYLDDEDTASKNVTISAKPSYTVSYNANGGSGVPGNQTKWCGEELTLSNTTPTKTGYTFNGWSGSDGKVYWQNGKYTGNSALTLTARWNPNTYYIKFNGNGNTGGSMSNLTMTYDTAKNLTSNGFSKTGHTFAGWATSANGSVVYSNAQSVKNLTTTSGGTYNLYAKWTPNTYTVSYNANGGSGVPGNQTKTYGQNLTLSSTIPTKSHYNFLGWATSKDATTATIQPGATYSTNAALTLYAVWELAYVKPRITNFTAFRSNAQGIADEAGTYVHVIFNWASDLAKRYIKVLCSDSSLSKDYSGDFDTGATSGAIDKIISGFSIETTYQVNAYVEDTKGSDYSSASSILNIPTASFPMDVKANGTGVAFGKVAETDDLMDVNFNANFRKQLKINGVNIFDVIYPIGSIYLSVNDTNPGTLFGGTWVAWGAGKVPVGVDASQTEFATVEKTGGNKTVDLSHTHTSAKHSHSSASHHHSSAKHSHSSAKHSHGRGNLIASINYQGGAFFYYYDSAQKPSSNYKEKVSTTESEVSQSLYGGTRVIGNTGETTPGNTGETTPGNTGDTTPGNTGETTPGNTGSALSNAQSMLQPYITCYMWKRTG